MISQSQSGGQRSISAPSDPAPTAAVKPGLPNGLTAHSATVGEICGEIMGLQRARRFCIVSQSRIDRSTEAFLRVQLGFNTLMPEADRKRLAAEARRLIKQVVADPSAPLPPNVPAYCANVILQAEVARTSWDTLRKEQEARMCELARSLPPYEFVKSVKGVGDLAFAAVVGEAGDLAGYPKHGHLWKRLGLATIDGVRQGRLPDNIPTADRAEAWKARGYNPHRRAEMFAFFDDVMLRHQWRADRDEDGSDPKKTGKPVAVPGHPTGPYGVHYARKKAEYVERGHPAPDRAARRYMTKKFLRDLWKAWCRANEKVSPGAIAALPGTALP